MGDIRIRAADVKKIIETNMEDADIMRIMADMANMFIDEHLADEGYSEEMLTKIELYLTAHFVAISEEGGTLTESELGDARDAWNTEHMGAGLRSTRYGQTVLTLDTSGALANVGTGALKAEFRVV